MMRLRESSLYTVTLSERDRLFERAQNLVIGAIEAGHLPKPTSRLCTDCDKRAFCYDHRDYRKPLEVEPVCQGCNNRRGPALPEMTDADGLRYKNPLQIRTGESGGTKWSALDVGDGYSPLESQCHVNVNDYECWWIDEGLVANGFDKSFRLRHNDARTWADRWAFFKKHDPYALETA